MNKLDSFIQNATRKIDLIALKPQMNGDGEAAKGLFGTTAFGSLLQDLSAKVEANPARGQHSRSNADGFSSEGEGVETPPRTDGVSDFSAITLPDTVASADPLLLEQAIASAVQTKTPSADRPQPRMLVSAKDAPLAKSTLSLPVTDDALPGSINNGERAEPPEQRPQLKVAVTHQETHFKPVPANSSFSFSRAMSAEEQVPGISQSLAGKQAPQPVADFQASLSARDANPAVQATRDQPVVASERGTPDPAASGAVLQRIAGAVVSEAKDVADDLRAEMRRTDSTPSVPLSRTSEGVVRMLNIQLHPAELGVVTVKMRLAGDRIEMELHVQADETAQLLRKDSEKLSALLRTSGYRPDVLTVHILGTDGALQDSAFGPRPQSQTQQQFGSHQSAAGSEDRSHERSAPRDNTDDRRKDRNDESAIAHRDISGLYL
ncbi:flagellar hook-length control protein FliK [Microvirga sp. 2MCAF38]|uniref:flagellar hook-length control protein FliK n=1 Tax=Microvirga sp. 2MCAF38 TaxID=3232989 RepID=UPI003F9A3719